MTLNYAPADGQTEAGAGMFVHIVQPVEDIEDTAGVFGINTDPIIADGKDGPFKLEVDWIKNCGA